MKWLLSLLLLVVGVASECPQLDLPWGMYSGSETNSICKYSNVRFASPPTGSLRFAAPEYPPPKRAEGYPLPPKNPGCYAMEETPCNALSADPSGCPSQKFSTLTEDCLFLDIWAPKDVLNQTTQVPVIVWFYGGAYVFGSKTQFDPTIAPFYDGSQIAVSSNEHAIFVAGNYRLGAFGWLAGDYMEKNAQPNAGLLDQQAILKFVRDYIPGHLLKEGTQVSVSAWGESAGASSILHHLVMPENVKRPLFHRAILQSPAYQFLWDRTGGLNDTYTTFANYSGCPDGDINCLRGVDCTVLATANQDLFTDLSCKGIMPVGPAVDGNLVPDIPSNLFSQPDKFTTLDSIIVSHVDLEVPIVPDTSKFSFIPQPIRIDPTNATKFDDFLSELMPGDAYSDIRANISMTYLSANYPDQVHRAQHVIMDGSFVCNTRIVLDAYMGANTPVYAMDYAFLADEGDATHASDLVPTFVTSGIDYYDLFRCKKATIPQAITLAYYVKHYLGPGMQEYFANHAVYGDPNKGSTKHANKPWSQAIIKSCESSNHSTQCVSNVMRPQFEVGKSPFINNTVTDLQSSENICGYWREVAQNITIACNKATGGKCTAPPSLMSALENMQADQIAFKGEL